MLVFFRAGFIVILCLFVIACGGKNASGKSANKVDSKNNEDSNMNMQKIPLNPLNKAFGNINDSDPLKIGKTPTPPLKNTSNPRPIRNIINPNIKALSNTADLKLDYINIPQNIINAMQDSNKQDSKNTESHKQDSKDSNQNIESNNTKDSNNIESKTTQTTLNTAHLSPALKAQNLPLFNPKTHSNNFTNTASKPILNSTNQPQNTQINIKGLPPDLFDKTSDFMVLMAANGVTLSIWATAAGNWLWGYALNSGSDLGLYRFWRFIFMPDSSVMIINLGTRTTCVNTYGEGVIHAPCDASNPYQRFELRAMTNGAVQIFNAATKKCLQTPIDDVFNGDVFGAINLSAACGDSIDLQWYLLPPPQVSSLYE